MGLNKHRLWLLSVLICTDVHAITLEHPVIAQCKKETAEKLAQCHQAPFPDSTNLEQYSRKICYLESFKKNLDKHDSNLYWAAHVFSFLTIVCFLEPFITKNPKHIIPSLSATAQFGGVGCVLYAAAAQEAEIYIKKNREKSLHFVMFGLQKSLRSQKLLSENNSTTNRVLQSNKNKEQFYSSEDIQKKLEALCSEKIKKMDCKK